MTIKAVVFDLDGTITEFNLDYKAVRREVCRILAEAGVPKSELSMDESTFALIRRARLILRRNGRTEEGASRTVEKALLTIEEREIQAAKTTYLLPGVRMTLQKLKDYGISRGLCTVNGEASTKIVLSRFRIADCFNAVVPRDQTLNIKPNKQHLEKVLNLLKVQGKETAVVGDGVSDMKCAKAVQAVAIGLPTGVSTRAELENGGAEYILAKMSELSELVSRINSVTKS